MMREGNIREEGRKYDEERKETNPNLTKLVQYIMTASERVDSVRE